jgi:glycosyltransferase involved in cell wall biosynthesis
MLLLQSGVTRPLIISQPTELRERGDDDLTFVVQEVCYLDFTRQVLLLVKTKKAHIYSLDETIANVVGGFTMRIVAVMACRNEAAVLPTCLHHLVKNGIDFAIVDNNSTDDSLDIAHSAEFRNHLVDLKRVPYEGIFQLEPLLEAKMALAESISADWAMNICPDEILHPNREGTTLVEEVEYFDKSGFNVVNFDEFVFLHMSEPWVEGLRDWPISQHYYFFEPIRFRQMRLWKKGQGFSMVRHGGHRLDGDNLRFAPESLVLRHYIFRNQAHAYEKFTNRNFSEKELAHGWHRNRHGIPKENYKFPNPDALEVLVRADSFALSRAHPWRKHYWQH